MVNTLDNKQVEFVYRGEILPKRLREAREYRGLSQKKIADLLGVQIASYGKYELGEREINASVLPIIANYEHLDINFFFDEEMNIKEADLDLRTDDKAIRILTREIQEIKEKIVEPNKIKSKSLNKIIDSLSILKEEALSRFEFIVDAFIQGEQNRGSNFNKQENDEKKKNAG